MLLIAYAGVGLVGTGTHFMVLFAAVDFVGPVIASSLGAIVGGIINYYLARDFVFLSQVNCLRIDVHVFRLQPGDFFILSHDAGMLLGEC